MLKIPEKQCDACPGCGPNGHGFSTVLVINRVSIWSILVLIRVWFLYFSPELGMQLKEFLVFFVI